MAEYKDREAFIPFTRHDLIELCLAEGKLGEEEASEFRRFTEILAAYYHFEFHDELERLKSNYAPFNPDRETEPLKAPTEDECYAMSRELTKDFEHVLRRANYFPLTAEDLKAALEEESLIDLRMQFDVDDFDEMVLYARGGNTKSVVVKKLMGLRKKELNVPNYERIVLLLKFKGKDYFEGKGQKISGLNFEPGKMYLYFYKNIPRYDLEVLFPNLHTHMNLKDRLLFGIPAVAVLLSVVIKILPQLLIIVGVVLFVTVGPSAAQRFSKVDESTVKDIMTLIAAVASLSVGLGGFAYKQYSNYRNKEMRLQKTVTETLFFKNLASNASVFQALIDAAEEEECKQIILVYYHLLTNPGELTKEKLDDFVEKWLEERFSVKIDFDVERTIQYLERTKGKLLDKDRNLKIPETALLQRDEGGICHPLALTEANMVIDYIWDNYFQYANVALESEQPGEPA